MLARSRALDLWRRTRAGERAQVRLEQGAGAASIAHEPESAVIRTTERRQARAAVRRLPPEQRQAIGLAYWAGLSAQEIATAERIPLGTAKSRVRLGLTKLSDDPSFAA
jgi:RNA polymerase sigma-70 factor (ECF subfamily)